MSDYLTRVDLIKQLNETPGFNLSPYSFTHDFRSLAARYEKLSGEKRLPFDYAFTSPNATFSVTVSVEEGDVLPRKAGSCEISPSLAQKIIAEARKKAPPLTDPRTEAEIATQAALIAALGESGYRAYMDDLDGLGPVKKTSRKPDTPER